MDNKVVQTLARAFVQLGYRAVRFNFRGIGASAGAWDEGRGEVDDALAVIAAHRDPALPLVLGGFSFGGYVATQAAARTDRRRSGWCWLRPAVVNFPAAPVSQQHPGDPRRSRRRRAAGRRARLGAAAGCCR